MTQHYELMFMIPGSVEATAVPEIKQRALGIISEFGGTITSQYDMGRRRLAFHIKDQTYGYYHVAQFDIETDQVMDLDKKFRLDHEILRYIVVKARPMTEAELKDMIEDDQDKNTEEEEVAANAVDDVAGALPVTSTESVAPVATVTPTEPETPVAAPMAEVPAEPMVEEAPTEATAESTEEPTAKPVEAPVEEPATEAPAPKLSIEDLDKQLDAILEDTDLETKL